MQRYSTTKVSTFTFRRLASPEEFLAAYKLRYEVFQQYWYRGVLHPHEGKFDIDLFDKNSVHYGLFKGEDLIGYVRQVIAQEQINMFNLNPVFVPEHISFDENSKGSYSLPMLATYPNNNELLNFFQSRLSLGGIIEVSRMAVRTDYQNHTLGNFLVESILVATIDFLNRTGGIALINCMDEHAPFYLGKGCKIILNEKMFGGSTCILGIPFPSNHALSSVPSYLHKNVAALMNEYRNNGQIHFHYEN